MLADTMSFGAIKFLIGNRVPEDAAFSRLHKGVRWPGEGCKKPLHASSKGLVILEKLGEGLCAAVDVFWL